MSNENNKTKKFDNLLTFHFNNIHSPLKIFLVRYFNYLLFSNAFKFAPEFDTASPRQLHFMVIKKNCPQFVAVDVAYLSLPIANKITY